MGMMSFQGAPKHLFDGSFSYQAQMKEVVLEILTFLPKMCKEDFFAFLDIWQGLALRQEEKDTVFILLYMHHNDYSFLYIYKYL